MRISTRFYQNNSRAPRRCVECGNCARRHGAHVRRTDIRTRFNTSLFRGTPRPALETRMHGLLRRAEAFSTSEWTTSCAIASRTRHTPGDAFSTSVSIDRCTYDFRSRLGHNQDVVKASADHDHAEQRTQTAA